MAEEQDKKEKPKTTLIKQKKIVPIEEEKDQSAKKDKKIVVVTKKVVKVKKVLQKEEPEIQPEIAAVSNRKEEKIKETPPIDDTKKTQPTNQDNRDHKYNKPIPENRNDRNIRDNRDNRDNRNTNNFRDNRNRPQNQYRGPTQNTQNTQNRPTFNRNFRKPGQPPVRHDNKEKTDNKGYVPRRKPPVTAGDKKPTPAADAKKQSARKFYFTKKKPNYQKSKYEEQKEKVLQTKKKETPKASPVPKEISMLEVITVSELARKMNLKSSELISKLMSMGMMATINQQIDAVTATLLAEEYGCKVKIVSLYDETVIETETDTTEDLLPRPPIVTVMGHVDHGKTKLLDTIRTANVVDSEFGGITQHIGAYTVDFEGHKIVFLDTPGHEAFTLMRARGAQLTDIVILVVAANDGVMPQTIEAINHAKEADVPVIVAINKIDLPDINIERIKKQLSEYGILPEEWGGHNIFCEISALKKLGIKELLDAIILQAEILELKSNYSCRAQGKVLESKIDFGRGIVATMIIERGTVRIGDSFVAGIFPGKVRAMFNDKGEKVKDATPGLPVEIIGFEGVPEAGDPFQVTDNERTARLIGVKRQELKKLEEAKNIKKVTLDNLYEKIKEGEIRELKVIIKGDVHGSVEALKTALEKLSTPEIKLTVIQALTGAINDGDITLAASATNAIVIGFHVRPSPSAQAIAEREKVEIRKYNIIYDAIEDIKLAMEGLLAPEVREETTGQAEVRQLFKVPKIGVIAGCHVLSGKIKRGSEAHVIRESVEIFKGKITSLRRFKDDAREVEAGFECGIGFDNFTDLKEGDIIEAFEIREIAKKLSDTIKEPTKESKEGIKK
jgi:translation initiation factor IF-2